MEQFEEKLHDELCHFLLSIGEVDERLPECPDVEEKWRPVVMGYLADGIREFEHFPTVSLGWMMYVGMAVARLWDDEWEIYGKIDDLYAYLRDKRSYDQLDDYIGEQVLQLDDAEVERVRKLVGSSAERVYHFLRSWQIEPGTKAAFRAYIACLHELYRMGAAVQLKRMGYRMVKE